MVIALLAVPILIPVHFDAGLAYVLNRIAGEEHGVAGPSALIGASNFSSLPSRRRSVCSVSIPVQRSPPWLAC